MSESRWRRWPRAAACRCRRRGRSRRPRAPVAIRARRRPKPPTRSPLSGRSCRKCAGRRSRRRPVCCSSSPCSPSVAPPCWRRARPGPPSRQSLPRARRLPRSPSRGVAAGPRRTRSASAGCTGPKPGPVTPRAGRGLALPNRRSMASSNDARARPKRATPVERTRPARADPSQSNPPRSRSKSRPSSGVALPSQRAAGA